MSDSKITRKPHPMGSLARRVILVCIAFLVVPLFLQDLFLYRREYRELMGAAIAYLQAVAKERSLFIEKTIQADWTLLDMIPEGAGRAPFLAAQKIEKIPLPQGVKDRFVLLNARREALLVGKKESLHYAWVMLVPLNELLKNLREPYPVTMTFQEVKGEDILQVEQPIAGTELSLKLAISMDHMRGLQRKNYYIRLAALFFFVGILGGAAVYLLTRRIARPLRRLSETMERVAEGATHVRYLTDWMGFEINELGHQFNKTMDSLLFHAEQAERERIGRERLAEELRIGHQIQVNLFPSHVPGLPGVDIATANLSAKEVNGDFYDLFSLPNGQLLIVMCDVAGKGISACLFALGLRSMLRSFASLLPTVEEIALKTNDLFWLDAHESAMFATLWLGLYDRHTGELSYCSQGHPPAFLRKAEHLQELWTEGIALGAQKLAVIPTQKVRLLKGDLLFLYTDGLIEAHDPEKRLFGKERLSEVLLRQKKSSAQGVLDQLLEEMHLFCQGAPQHDDISLLALQICD